MASRLWARTSIATSVATWSLRERAVWSFPPTGPTISVRRRSIAMWMSSSFSVTTKRVRVDLRAHRVEPALDRLEVVVADDPAARQHARVGARLLEVVRRQPVVEADRRVERLEERVLGVGEAAHRGRESRLSAVRVRKARQDDVAAVAPLLYESAPDDLRPLRRRPRARARHARAGVRASPATSRAARSYWVAEVDGRLAAAMAAFPLAEGGVRSRAFLRLTLRRLPFWRWRARCGSTRAAARRSSARGLALHRRARHGPGLPPPRRRPRAARGQAEHEARAQGLRRRHARHDDRQRRRARPLRARRLRRGGLPRARRGLLPGFVALVKPVDR